jgi:hypothetical protein
MASTAFPSRDDFAALLNESFGGADGGFEGRVVKGSVEGVIFGRVKGGFTVDLDGAVAFLPGSAGRYPPVRDVTPLMGIPQPFQILKMDRAAATSSFRAAPSSKRAAPSSAPNSSNLGRPDHRRRGQEHHRLRCVR